jgi:hypothetical protein
MNIGESCPVHEAITCFDSNVKRINYTKFCEERRSIGGGNVEATRQSFYA